MFFLYISSIIRKFHTIICLNFFRFISKIFYTSFYEIHCTFWCMFIIPIQKSFSTSFIYTSILIEFPIFWHIFSFTFQWYKFYIYLPFFAYLLWCMIFLVMFSFTCSFQYFYVFFTYLFYYSIQRCYTSSV